jgi:two-component system response regulator AtoC
VLASQIGDLGHQVEHVGTGEAAVQRLNKGDVDIALCDIRLPDISGIEVVKRSVAANADTIFLMMTAYASVNTAIEAMKAGAFDYLIKPVRLEDIELRFSQLGELMRLREENQRLRRMVPEQLDEVCVLASAEARKVERIVSRVAVTDGTVLITGESGTGKGVIARAIHRQSLRSAYPLVEVNCGAIPENLLEAEFFGHLKGAFTGADRAKKGLLREADGGTILLDEIAELPLILQVKLLHAIEDKLIRPVGSEQSRRIDVRIIAATNKNLEARVESGEFREDLFYRLNVLNIDLLPLRERREDIATLLDYFLTQGPKQLGIGIRFSMEPEARQMLISYDWPGNIRQVQNVIHRMLVLADGEKIGVADLPSQITKASAGDGGSQSGSTSLDSLREQTLRFEVRVIQQAIENAGGDRQVAAQKLGIGVSTLYRKLEEHEKLAAT